MGVRSCRALVEYLSVAEELEMMAELKSPQKEEKWYVTDPSEWPLWKKSRKYRNPRRRRERQEIDSGWNGGQPLPGAYEIHRRFLWSFICFDCRRAGVDSRFGHRSGGLSRTEDRTAAA